MSMENTDINFFKCEVKEYDDIDCQINKIKETIKPLNEKIKTLKQKRDDLQVDICSYMSKNEIDQCNLNSGKLEFKESKAVKPITKASIYDKINEFFDKNFTDEFKKLSSEQKARELHTFIYEDREYSAKTFLRRKL
jgi:hypothetical protein